MCFSARASFVASGVLLTIGAYAVHVAPPGAAPFSAMPIVFAAHQATEGVLWLTGPGKRWTRLNKAASYAFFAFALMVWPFYVPLCVYALETSPLRKLLALVLLVCGTLFSLGLIHLVRNLCVPTRALYEHIVYDSHIPESTKMFVVSRTSYISFCVLPFFVSSHIGVTLFGLCQMASFFVAARWYRQSLTSVWCYFAALLSALVPVFVRL